MAKVVRRARCRDWGTLNLVLTDNVGMRQLHDRWMGKPVVTDVLSQNYAPIPGGPALIDSEVVVNVQRAAELAPRHWSRPGWRTEKGASHELALYIAHGCDHLSGADDATLRQQRRMRLRELRWLREARRAGVLTTLVMPRRKSLPLR